MELMVTDIEVSNVFISSVFDFDKSTKTFSQDISILGEGGRQVLGRISDDSLDEGLTIVSVKNGSSIDYMIESMDECNGDIMGWRLVPTPQSERDFPGCRGTKVVIF